MHSSSLAMLKLSVRAAASKACSKENLGIRRITEF